MNRSIPVADDFLSIRQRLEELKREKEEAERRKAEQDQSDRAEFLAHI